MATLWEPLPIVFLILLALVIPVLLVIYAEELAEVGGMFGLAVVPAGSPSWIVRGLGLIVIAFAVVALCQRRFSPG